MDSLKKDIGRGRYEFWKMTLLLLPPETRKLPEKTTKLQKFTQDGSGPEKFPNLAQMFLRSRRCSSKNLAQKGIRMKKKTILEAG